MGHASLETTMGYLHTESLSVSSPLKLLENVAKASFTRTGIDADLQGRTCGATTSILSGKAQADPLTTPTLMRAERRACTSSGSALTSSANSSHLSRSACTSVESTLTSFAYAPPSTNPSATNAVLSEWIRVERLRTSSASS